jgi:quinol monooxygenase YgiN
MSSGLYRDTAIIAGMVNVLTHVQVEDAERFWSVFSTRGRGIRRRHGSTSARVFQTVGEPNSLVLLFEWSSPEGLEAFRSDPETPEAMKASGAIGQPTFTLLEPFQEPLDG